jgi:hypothetical protein
VSGAHASGTASGGTFIACSWHRGCSAQFHGSAFTNTRGARQEARREGWLVGQEGGRFANSLGHVIRVDYCPEHAPRERERRGLRSVIVSSG